MNPSSFGFGQQQCFRHSMQTHERDAISEQCWSETKVFSHLLPIQESRIEVDLQPGSDLGFLVSSFCFKLSSFCSRAVCKADYINVDDPKGSLHAKHAFRHACSSFTTPDTMLWWKWRLMQSWLIDWLIDWMIDSSQQDQIPLVQQLKSSHMQSTAKCISEMASMATWD